MTVANTTARNQYTATAAQTIFPYTFEIFAKEDVAVEVDGVLKAEGTDYTVSGVGNDAGGNITFLVGRTSGEIVTIYRDMNLERLVDYQQSGDFLAEDVNDDFDRLWLALQQLQSKYSLSIRASIDDAILNSSNTELADPTTRAGKALGFGPTGLLSYLSSAVPLGDFFYFSTVAAMQASSGLKVNDVVIIGERANSLWDVIAATTNNGYDVLEGTASSVSLQLRDRDPVTTKALGIPADGTDQTSALVTFFNTLSETNKLFYEISFGTSFNRTTIIAAMPKGLTILDHSGYDFNSSGETVKKFGIMDFGSTDGAFDAHWSVESGHHAILELNNHGNSGSLSASERKASLLWSTGTFVNEGENKRGFRGAAIQQFTQDTGNTFWTWGIRSLAPWVAIDANYEQWITGESIGSTGVYRSNGANHYISASTGTTGATAPTHTSGTVSDGGVDWTYVDSADRSIIQLDQYNRLLMGTGSFSETFRHKVTPTDPNGGNYSMVLEATGASKFSQIVLNPTNGSGAVSAQPFLRAQDANGLQIMRSDASTSIASFTDSGGFDVSELRLRNTTAADADTTPSVDGVSTLYLSNTGATNITALDDGSDNQIVRLIATNTNTTLVSSATFLLQGSVNLSMGIFDVVTMQKVPNSISDRWIEVGRSIK